MSGHTEFPWCIPTGDSNGFIICAGDDPKKPGPILMIVTAPRGRSRVLTDADINNNTAFMVKAAQSHADLVKALEEIRDCPSTDDESFRLADCRQIARAALATLTARKVG